MDALQAVEDAQELLPAEGGPGIVVSPEEHAGELAALVSGEAELVGSEEGLPAEDIDVDVAGHWISSLRGQATLRRIHREGACAPDGGVPPDTSEELKRTRSGWWTVGRQDSPPDGVTIQEMRDAALILCRRCPVQWDCVRWAIDNEEYDTWAAWQSDRARLARLLDWRQLVDAAEAEGVAVVDLISMVAPRPQRKRNP